MKRYFAMLLAVIMLLSMVACAAPAAPAAAPAEPAPAAEAAPAPAAPEAPAAEEGVQTIKIGVVAPLTGGGAFQGNLCKEGYDYAAYYYNNVYGGIKSMNGAKLELYYADHTSVADVGITETERLINQVGVDVLTGTTSSTVMLAIAPLCEKYHITMVDNVASSIEISNQGFQYVFNPFADSITNAQALVNLVQMIEKKYGETLDNVAFISENTEWGIQNGKDLQERFEKAGKTVVYNETCELGTTDFSSIITKIKASGAKFVVPTISEFSDAVVFVNQFKEYKCDAAILSGGGCMITNEFLEAVGENAEYMFSTECWSKGFLTARGDSAVAIHQGYVDQYGHDMGEYAGISFGCISLIVAALEECGTTDKEIFRDTFYNLDLDLTSEYMQMIPYERMKLNEVTEDGLTLRNIYSFTPVSQVIDGKWTMVCPDEILEHNPIVWPIPE